MEYYNLCLAISKEVGIRNEALMVNNIGSILLNKKIRRDSPIFLNALSLYKNRIF